MVFKKILLYLLLNFVKSAIGVQLDLLLDLLYYFVDDGILFEQEWIHVDLFRKLPEFFLDLLL